MCFDISGKAISRKRRLKLYLVKRFEKVRYKTFRIFFYWNNILKNVYMKTEIKITAFVLPMNLKELFFLKQSPRSVL